MNIFSVLTLYAQKSKIVLNKEIVFHIGPSVFQGDITSGLYFSDKKVNQIKFENSNLNIGSGIIYHVSPGFSFKTNVNILQLYGDDAWGKNAARMLKFKTYLIDFSAMLEYSYSYQFIKKNYLTISTGFSVINFYPMGEYNGKWYNLRKASTEGQGLKNGTDRYRAFSVSLPVNFGYFFEINNRDKLGIELCFRKAFTDYIDDVSGRYYNNTEIKNQKGEWAANLADPKPQKTPAGVLRGNPSKDDNYTIINFSYRRLLGVKYVTRY